MATSHRRMKQLADTHPAAEERYTARSLLLHRRPHPPEPDEGVAAPRLPQTVPTSALWRPGPPSVRALNPLAPKFFPTLLCSPPPISGSPEMSRPEQELPVEEPKEAPCAEEAARGQAAEIDPALDHFQAKRERFERGSSLAATIPRSEPPSVSPGSTKAADKVPQDASDVVEEKWEALPPTLPRRVLQALFVRTFTKLVGPPGPTTLA